MSLHKTPAGEWRVRWRDPDGRNRSRTIGRKRDAEAFDAETRRRQRLGGLGLVDAGAETLDAYVRETWLPTHAAHLSPGTRSQYGALLDSRILPRLGGVRLRDLTGEMIGRWHADVLAEGARPHSARKALALLGGILQRAAEAGRIPANPARVVRRAPLPPRAEVRPLAPAAVEAIRASLRDRPDAERGWALDLGHRDATLVSLLAYAGLRPGEAIGLRWGHVLDRTLVVNAPKTRTRRSVRLLDPLADDLGDWQAASGRPGDGDPVIPGADGAPWTGYRKWQARTWKAALRRAGVGHARPYDLRHSFASLLLHEGRSVHYVARQLGHGAELTLGTYGHVIEELDDAPQLPAEDAIRAARGGKSVPSVFLGPGAGP